MSEAMICDGCKDDIFEWEKPTLKTVKIRAEDFYEQLVRAYCSGLGVSFYPEYYLRMD